MQINDQKRRIQSNQQVQQQVFCDFYMIQFFAQQQANIMVNNQQVQMIQQLQQENAYLKNKFTQPSNVQHIENLKKQHAAHEAELLYQIHELQTRLHEKEEQMRKQPVQEQSPKLEARVYVLEQERDKYKQFAQKLLEENNKFYVELQQKPLQILDQQVQVNQSGIKKMTEKLHILHDHLREKMKEMEKLEQLLALKENEVEELRQNNKGGEYLKNQLKLEGDKIVLLKQENSRLLVMLDDKNKQIETLKRNIVVSRNYSGSQLVLSMPQQSSVEIDSYVKEIDILKMELRNKDMELQQARQSTQGRQSSHDFQRYQSEISRLQELLEIREREIVEIREFSDSSEKVQILENEVQRQNRKIYELMQENEQLEVQLKEAKFQGSYQTTVKEYEYVIS